MLPFIPNEEALALIKGARAVVFVPSEEGFGYPLVEAMAAGNAILYLDTPSNRETASGCGIAFDPQELGIKLRQLIAAPDRVEKLREEARIVARETYGWERGVDQYEALFVKMLCSERPV